MCELMGICSNIEVDPRFSFKEIKLRGGSTRPHRDGWGIGFYKDRKSNIIKEPEPAYSSQKARDIEEGKIELHSKLFITHIRLSSSGNPSYDNTHPFTYELFGKDWIFAHNGTVGKYEKQNDIFKEKLVHFKPKGQTDSEHAFCYILDKLQERCTNKSTLAEFAKVIGESANYIKKYGNFNFLLSDSEHLYAFGDNSLYFTLRQTGNYYVTLEDSDYSVNVSEMKREDEKATIIATRPLTKEEKWHKIDGLKIFANGNIVKI